MTIQEKTSPNRSKLIESNIQVNLLDASKCRQMKKVLSPLDEAAAKKLEALWLTYKRLNPGSSQKAVAKSLGWSQSNFNQYIKGSVPLGNKALDVFCGLFDCERADIREEFRDESVILELKTAKRLLKRTLKSITVSNSLKNSIEKFLNNKAAKGVPNNGY